MIRLLLFVSQDANESRPEDAIALLITANPIRFKASRRLIFLSVFISLIFNDYAICYLSAKIKVSPKNGLTKNSGLDAIFTV